MDNTTFAQNILAQMDTDGQEVEIYIESAKETNIMARRGEVEKLSFAGSKGLGIRIIRGGRTGYAYTSDFGTESVQETIATAEALAQTADADAKRKLPPVQAIPTEDLAIYDETLATQSIDNKIALALEMIEATYAYDPRVVMTQFATYVDGIGDVTLVNSNGFVGRYERTMAGAYLMAMAAEGDDRTTAFGFSGGSNWSDLDPASIGAQAGKSAVSLLGGESIASHKGTVVYSPWVGVNLLGAMSSAFTAEALQRNRSFLQGRIGQSVAADNVSILDNGRLPGGMGSRPFDSEGNPTRATKLIDEGIFEGVIHNQYTAEIDGTNSTGNASRGSHRGLPQLAPSNFYLQPGPISEEELIAGVEHGVYVINTMNTHAINPINGDYSVSAEGILIENGKLTRPVTGITLAIPLADMLQSVSAVANNLTFIPIAGSVGAPTFRIDGVMIGGSA